MGQVIEEIITDILKAEGWDTYTNHPADRGGPTKWGITLEAWGEYLARPVSAFNIQGITEHEARTFYRNVYFTATKYDRIDSEFLIACVADAAVNHGAKRASKWLQRAVGVAQDGSIGPITLQAVNAANPTVVALRFLAYRVKFYGYIVTRNPSQAVFASGWNNRAAKWIERLADYHEGG